MTVHDEDDLLNLLDELEADVTAEAEQGNAASSAESERASAVRPIPLKTAAARPPTPAPPQVPRLTIPGVHRESMEVLRTRIERAKEEDAAVLTDQRWGAQLLQQKMVSGSKSSRIRRPLGALALNGPDTIAPIGHHDAPEATAPHHEAPRATERSSSRTALQRAKYGGEERLARSEDELWLQAERQLELRQAAMAKRRSEDLEDIDRCVVSLTTALRHPPWVVPRQCYFTASHCYDCMLLATGTFHTSKMS